MGHCMGRSCNQFSLVSKAKNSLKEAVLKARCVLHVPATRPTIIALLYAELQRYLGLKAHEEGHIIVFKREHQMERVLPRLHSPSSSWVLAKLYLNPPWGQNEPEEEVAWLTMPFSECRQNNLSSTVLNFQGQDGVRHGLATAHSLAARMQGASD